MRPRIFATTGAIAKVTILALVVVVTAGANLAFAATPPDPDPDLEIFRIRCQIDVNPGEANQVQIQGKARAELLDGQTVIFTVTNGSATSSAVSSTFSLGSASADWDTNPDPGDPDLATFIPADFAADDDIITITAVVGSTGQSVSKTGKCAEKVGSQFRRDTRNVCSLKKYNRGKCKSGDVLPDGTIQP